MKFLGQFIHFYSEIQKLKLSCFIYLEIPTKLFETLNYLFAVKEVIFSWISFSFKTKSQQVKVLHIGTILKLEISVSYWTQNVSLILSKMHFRKNINQNCSMAHWDN